jgi:putative holliday junction resolvase
MSERGRVVLGLDVGEARIGVARGEIGSPLVFGRGAIRRPARQRDAVAEVAAVAAREGATLLAVGLPVRAQGGDSAQTQRVRAFGAALAAAGLEVAWVDERFTTAFAQQQLRAGGGRRHAKGAIDEAAAIAILQTFLERGAVSGGGA